MPGYSKKKKWDFTCPLESNGAHLLKWILLFHLVGGVLYIVSMGGVFNIGSRDYDLTYTHIVHIMSCTADIKNCCNSTNAHIHIHRHIHIYIYVYVCIYIYVHIYICTYIYAYMYPNKKMGFNIWGQERLK